MYTGGCVTETEVDDEGRSPLHMALYNGAPLNVVEMLEERCPEALRGGAGDGAGTSRCMLPLLRGIAVRGCGPTPRQDGSLELLKLWGAGGRTPRRAVCNNYATLLEVVVYLILSPIGRRTTMGIFQCTQLALAGDSVSAFGVAAGGPGAVQLGRVPPSTPRGQRGPGG